jgi:hypothetical protein
MAYFPRGGPSLPHPSHPGKKPRTTLLSSSPRQGCVFDMACNRIAYLGRHLRDAVLRAEPSCSRQAKWPTYWASAIAVSAMCWRSIHRGWRDAASVGSGSCQPRGGVGQPQPSGVRLPATENGREPESSVCPGCGQRLLSATQAAAELRVGVNRVHAILARQAAVGVVTTPARTPPQRAAIAEEVRS